MFEDTRLTTINLYRNSGEQKPQISSDLSVRQEIIFNNDRLHDRVSYYKHADITYIHYIYANR